MSSIFKNYTNGKFKDIQYLISNQNQFFETQQRLFKLLAFFIQKSYLIDKLHIKLAMK